MDAPEITPSPDCPICNAGNTWGKHMLSRDYDEPDANVFCKNCRSEFFAPPNWFMMDDWREDVKTFND